MKKQNLTIDRIDVQQVSPNHIKVTMFNQLELDISFIEHDKPHLFAVTHVHPETKKRAVFCKELPKGNHRNALHYNVIEPNHKKRFAPREWKKWVNRILSHFKYELPEVQ